MLLLELEIMWMPNEDEKIFRRQNFHSNSVRDPLAVPSRAKNYPSKYDCEVLASIARALCEMGANVG